MKKKQKKSVICVSKNAGNGLSGWYMYVYNAT